MRKGIKKFCKQQTHDGDVLTGVLIIHEQEGRVWKIYRFLLKVYPPSVGRVYPPAVGRGVFGKDSCCEEKFKTIIICDGGQSLSFNIS